MFPFLTGVRELGKMFIWKKFEGSIGTDFWKSDGVKDVKRDDVS